MFRFFYIFIIITFLSACGGGGSSDSESNETAPSQTYSIYSYSTLANNQNCPNGGVLIHFGFDQNENGLLDNEEIDSSQDATICHGTNGQNGSDGSNGSNGQNGTNGQNSLVKLSNEASGTNCPNGGVKVESGLDANTNNVLDNNEVSDTQYVCNSQDGENGVDGTDGENGTDGQDGTNGLNALLTLTNEPAGDNCPNGGIIAKSGLDLNNNNNLEDDEVTNSQYVCNGEDLTETLTVLMVTSTEPPGSNCPAGGEKFSSGIDDNNDGTLQINEVDAVSYSCTVLSEYNTLTDIESAPTNICLHGGLITYVGLDYNGNGTLDTEERQSQTVSCASNEAPTITIPSSSYLANVNVAFSQSFPVNDADSDVLSITDATKPAWLSLNVIGNNVIASGTPRESDIGQYSVSFSITDSELSEEASFLLGTQAAPDNLGTFPYSTLELGEAGFSKIVDFEFADAAAFDRTVTFTAEASSTATESQDFNINYASQTVPAGETKTFFELEIINDTAYENIETIVINATVDAETVDQVIFSLNDNTGYEVLGALPEPLSPQALVIVDEKVEISTSNYQYYIYDLNLEAITSSCYSFPGGCSQFTFAWDGHSYLNNYYSYDETTNQVKKYNPESARYEVISDLPADCENAMNTSFQEHKLYILGCQSEYEESTGTLYTYDLNTDSWQLITNSGPDFTENLNGYEWSNIIEVEDVLYFYRYIFSSLLSFDLNTKFSQTENLNSNLSIFSDSTYTYLPEATRVESDKWIVPLNYKPAPTTKIVEFDPVTKTEAVHEFNIGQNAGNGVIFHNGKWFYFGGSNNLGTSDRVVSFIIGDN